MFRFDCPNGHFTTKTYVVLKGATMKIVTMSVSPMSETSNALDVIERAYRIAYQSEPKPGQSQDEFIKSHMNHESPLEHASAGFLFIVDRGVSHEMVRHRLAAYTQESTRYCNYGKDKFGGEITVIEPPGLNPHQASMWRTDMWGAEKTYLDLLQCGAKPQISRAVLPTCLKTQIAMTCNFREWRHVLKLRTVKDAHPQIREVMLQVLAYFRKTWPVIVHDITTVEDLPDHA
jgi:thymidylate synthase (FAD)